MGGTAHIAACRFSIAVALAWLALGAGGARAGTYEVVACDTAPGGAHGSWSPRATDKMGTGQFCPSAGREAGGLFAGNAVNVGTIPAFAASQQYFEPPPGTSIVFLAARYMFRRFDPYWRLGVFADSHMLHGCEPAAQETGCHFNSQSIDGDSTWGWAPGQIHQVSIVTACGSGTGCRSDAAAPTGDRAGVRLYGATVRVHDDSLPSVVDDGNGALTNGRWQRGTNAVGFHASDNVGLRRTRLYVDGNLLRDDERGGCNYALARPCPDVPHSLYDVNTGGLPDGRHVARVEVVDAAGNAAAMDRVFHSDNTPPAAPRDLRVDGGQGWRRTNSFRVAWTNPASAAPITVARYRLCSTATQQCTTGARQGEGIASIGDLSVPAPGDYTLRLWLEDQAGNVNEANRSDEVRLRFDDVPPGEALPAQHDGWLNAAQAVQFDQEIRQRPGGVVPVSGIAGYSVTLDGSQPDGQLDVAGHLYRLRNLPEGVVTLRARAISGSGVPSASVGTATIRVDRSSPVAGAAAAPAAEGWVREPVKVTLAGTDQVHLSGMDGGRLEYRLDGGEPQSVRGGSALATVDADGQHTLTVVAFDAAGNRSPERGVGFRIDRTAPELVVFEAPDASDPRRVVVAASDRTSGVAGAVIEMRRIGSERWIEVPSVRDGDRFAGTVDDEAAERGVYELRARVTDRAGNESAGDRRRDGSAATVDTTVLRGGTKLTAALVTRSATTSKRVCTKRRPGVKRRCRKKTAKTPGGALTGTLSVPFAKGAVARGTLETEAGAPLANAVVDVYARSTAAGSGFERVDAVRTDPKGAFGYTVRAGTSRVIRFHFEGDGRHRPSEEAVTLRVAAAATIKASHRTRRNGQTVTFRGKLRSQPIPAAGKVVDLQAHYRGKWRTFATPRANPKGKWSYRYRFGATRGTVPYRFRVLIRPEAAYPYDLGHSETVRVVVRGP